MVSARPADGLTLPRVYPRGGDFYFRKFLRITQTCGENLQIAARSRHFVSVVTNSRQHTSLKHPCTHRRAFSPRRRIFVHRANSPEFAEGEAIANPAARSRIIGSRGSVVWQTDCLVRMVTNDWPKWRTASVRSCCSSSRAFRSSVAHCPYGASSGADDTRLLH